MEPLFWENLIDESDLAPIAEAVWYQLNQLTYPCLLLKGNLGAGKTTFVKHLLKKQDPQVEVSSPSFGIVNEYSVGNKKVFHFDLYRIKNAIELDELGFAEYLDSGNICLIEWPDAGINYYRDHVLELVITIDEKNKRKISLQALNF